MFKLLTDEKRKEIEREYTIRRAIVFLFCLTLVLIVGVIGLLPSYLLSQTRLDEAARDTAVTLMSLRGDEEELRSWLAEVNIVLKTIDPALDADYPSEFFERIISAKVPGVRITGLSWSKEKSKPVLLVNGVANDRQALVSFENKIKSSKYFSDATLPVSNLAKDKDIDFQMKFSPVLTTRNQ